MRSEQLHDAIGQVDDKLIAATERLIERRPGRMPARLRVVAAMIAACLVGGGVFLWSKAGRTDAVTVLAEPVYPERALRPLDPWVEGQEPIYPDEESPDVAGPGQVKPNEGSADSDEEKWELYEKQYDIWWEDHSRRIRSVPPVDDELMAFTDRMNLQILAAEDGKNHLYSPVNLYLALAMMAETAAGASREEILTALDVKSMEELRTKAADLWNSQYVDDGSAKSVLGSSIWIDDGVKVKKDAMAVLAEIYRTFSFQGDLQKPELITKLRSWLNDMTGGLLQDSVNEFEFSELDRLVLTTTIFFKATWGEKFNKQMTAKGEFHALTGDIEVDFMSATADRPSYWGECFSAIGKSLIDVGHVWFILPDEGVKVSSLLSDPQIKSLLRSNDMQPYAQQKYVQVKLKIPKFDLASENNMQLREAMQKLGVKKVFSPEEADLSTITDYKPIFVEDIYHSARLTIDEDGVTGAAYTIIPDPMALPPPGDKVDMVFDRPFLVVVQGVGNVPLFVGIVNQP